MTKASDSKAKVLREAYLLYYNKALYDKGLIDERTYRRMIQLIQSGAAEHIRAAG